MDMVRVMADYQFVNLIYEDGSPSADLKGKCEKLHKLKST